MLALETDPIEHGRMGGDVVELFESKLERVRYVKGPVDLSGFTEEEVEAYIREKARRRHDFGGPYDDVIRLFPESTWRAAVQAIGADPEAPSAVRFLKSVFERHPAFFAGEPERVIDIVGTAAATRFMRQNRELAVRGLRDRMQRGGAALAAGMLVLLEPDSLAEVSDWLESLPDERARVAAYSVLKDFGLGPGRLGLRRLWPLAGYHIVFPSGYLAPRRREDIAHTESAVEVAFGGVARVPILDSTDSLELAHVLTLDPVPAGLGVSLRRLQLVIDLEKAEEDGSPQYFRHDEDGSPNVRDDEATPMPPFKPARVRLEPMHEADSVETHGEARGRGANLSRLGGFPIFVQSPVFPKCVCELPMSHLVSLASGIPTEDGEARDWGNGSGVANGFWCDPCRRSAWTWSCS
ncbi:MAG: hypothetical protein U0271_45265 [Polyangiaceae bacterium]